MTTRNKKPEGDEVPQPTASLPILPLRNSVLFPGLVMPLVIGREKTLRLLDLAAGKDEPIGVLTQKDKDIHDPNPEDLYTMGTTARILRIVREREQGVDIVVQGIQRFQVNKFTQTSPFLAASVTLVPEEDRKDVETEALMRTLKALTTEVLQLIPEMPSSAGDMVDQVESPSRLVYLIASNLPISTEEKMQILGMTDVADAMRTTLKILHHHLEVLRVTQKINTEVKGELNKSQREYLLRQQIKAIQKELGELEDDGDILDELQDKLVKMVLPDEVRKVAEKEMRRLRSIQPSSPEYTVARTYLDWICELPWGVSTPDNLDVPHARQVLDEDHYDLDKIKKRILEYLAVSKLRNNLRGPILCLVGPPGVGKTSLGQSVARALGRKFVHVSLGGVRDEAEIRGHRRTYIGALPGKIIQSLKRAESKNPVFMMDEIDKLGRDWRGDPTSALLEVLDPEQNHSFMDHYLDVPFDLSSILFITTANVTDTIPPPLMDRMELLELPGYTPEEKIAIARRHLLPKQIKEHGLTEAQVPLTDKQILFALEHWTREAGVRNLERVMAGICRGIAVKVVEGTWAEGQELSETIIGDFLGPEQFAPDAVERTECPGIATGLAWTSTGGEILYIEASKMAGKGRLKLTGQLGDVMKESAQIALSYLQSNALAFGVDERMFETADLHIHVPAGAIPKDGPSAGVTMFTALFSLMTGRKVRSDTAMTGEITLRGLVLPIGGIKNKVLAAQRGGISRIVLPERNRKDLTEIPEQVRREMEFVFVRKMDELLLQVIERKEGEDLFKAPIKLPESVLPRVSDDDEDEVPEVRKPEVLEDLPPRPTV
jgi:ATP-dependent Lon protease